MSTMLGKRVPVVYGRTGQTGKRRANCPLLTAGFGQKKPGNWAGLETHKCGPRREVTRAVQNTSLDCRRLWRKISITMHHQEQDVRSLALHTAAVELMRADETLIQQALDRLARWDTHVSTCSKPLRDEWVRILRERDWELALSTSERGNQLRQASPVSCVLPNERRLEIIRATSKWSLPNATTRQALDQKLKAFDPLAHGGELGSLHR